MATRIHLPLSDVLDAGDLPAHLFPPDAAGALEHVYLLDSTVAQTPEGSLLASHVAVDEELRVGLPILPLSFVLGPTDPDDPGEVRVRLEDDWFVEAHGIPLALRFDPALLRPVDEALPFTEIAARGSVRLDAGTLRHVDPALSFDLPLSQVAGLPLYVGLEGILFDFSEAASSPEVLELGYDASFRGVYAASGRVVLLPMLDVAGGKGIEVEAAGLAVSERGVTVSLGRAFRVDRAGGTIGDATEVRASLFSDRFQVALETVELELFDSAPRAFRAAGVLKLPFVDGLLDLEFSLRAARGGGVGYGMKVVQGYGGTVSTPFGPLSFGGVELEGEVGPDGFAVAGTVSEPRLAGEAFSLGAGSASARVEHRDGHTSFRLRLADVAIGERGRVAAAELMIGERRADGEIVHRLLLEVDQPIPLGETGVVLEKGKLEIEVADDADGVGGWKELLENARLELTGFRLTGSALPGGALAGDLKVVFRDGSLDSSRSYLKRHEPDAQHLAELGLKHVSIGKDHLAVTWSEPRVNYWLSQLLPGVADDSAPAEHELTLRVLFGAGGITEIRFDWLIEHGARTLKLPGVDVTTPGTVRLTLLLGAGGGPLTRAALALTFDRVSTPLIAASTFAWERGADRELQTDPERNKDDGPLLQLTLGVDPKHADKVTLALLDLDVAQASLPTFLRQLPVALGPLDWDDREKLAAPTPWAPESLTADRWKADFHINAEKAPFELPFLKQEEKKPEAGDFPQLLRVDRPRLSEIAVHFDEHSVTVPVGVTLALGDLRFSTDIQVGFNWERFALVLDPDGAIEMVSEKPELAPEAPHLGFLWKLKGGPIRSGKHAGKYTYFSLVTKDYNYQVVQSRDAAFEIAYTGVSDEPITFTVTDFAVTSKGVSLNAAVTDRPAKLNGIDTRFRFNDTRIEVRENRIADFTLSGSGPLPPALVGDATADLALRFGVRGGGLTLLGGAARLRGAKVLDCRGTRFRFSVDALGVKFVNDGRFHLYFTLTGAAEFVPAGGDDANGPLALLGKIRIDLVDAPLSGDMKVLAKHVRFLVELPRPKSFNFLGAFEMELRGIGFVPSADVFGGDAAMMLTGQLKFAQGAGDTPDSRTDVHTLYIGLPKPGTFVPRIHFKELPVHLNFGSAFRLNGTVEFIDTPQEKGFTGEGVLQIQGLPTIAASFAFLRVRRDENSPWVRAWFIYIEARQVSFPIPVVNLYLREIGLGFGYRYTLVAIKAADRENDVRKLLASLKTLSRTAGDLSKRDRWAVDLEEEGEDPRWTIVLRALISQTSASASPLQWNESSEKTIPCTFLFDAVIAFRSDLTFLMAVRAWLNANYYDYVSDYKGLRGKPLFSGFVLLSPRQKRLLANLSSNPDGQLGPHPPLPDFVQKALSGAQFTATVLIEPGLLHYEMGWPNMLRWQTKVGPLNADFRGGMIFRIAKKELVTGVSFLARAGLQFQAGLDLGFVGARVSASASLAFGARYIGVVDFADPTGNSALYAGVGVEIHVKVNVEFWIKLKLGFVKIQKTFRFSLNIDFTAGLEVGFVGISTSGVGLRGHGTLSVKCMGRSLQLSVRIGLNEGAVTRAKARTQQYLNLGLEATEVEGVPGVDAPKALAAPAASFAVPGAAREPVFAAERFGPHASFAAADPAVATAPAPRALGLGDTPLVAADRFGGEPPRIDVGRGAIFAGGADPAEVEEERFDAPEYSVFVVRLPKRSASDDAEAYFVLLPQGEKGDGSEVIPENGFLPPPPRDPAAVESDFALELPRGDYALRQWDPAARRWTDRAGAFAWKADWAAPIAAGETHEVIDGVPTGEVKTDETLTLADWLVHAFRTRDEDDGAGGTRTVAFRDPDALPGAETVADERVHNPSDEAFEAAVRGAVEQFGGAPFLRRGYVRDAKGDVVPAHEYERALDLAFSDATTIYTGDGAVPTGEAATRMLENQQAQQLRGMVVHDLVSDLRDAATEAASKGAEPAADPSSVAFALGLVFHVKGKSLPAWLDRSDTAGPTLRQRARPGDSSAGSAPVAVRTYNVAGTDFSLNPPLFQRVQQLADATTVAVAWDLVWERGPRGVHVASQADPEQHLAHYQVRRRALSGTERDAEFTVKPADALHRPSGGGGLQALRARFQLVDHFTHETPEETAALRAEGRSYLYTITPVDFAGNPGRPLTVVATRFPNQPPLVPTDAELVVSYLVAPDRLAPAAAVDLGAPNPPALPVIDPARVHLEWSEPAAAPGAPVVPVGETWVVFRRDATLPIGSYGLDGSTQGPRGKRLPTSNARALPTDLRVKVTPTGERACRSADVPLADLRELGVLPPADGGAWKPESWRVFVQTVSANDVPSALAPVQLLLRAQPRTADTEAELPKADRCTPTVLPREERRPAELEWIPSPARFPLLPPEDQRAAAGPAHVPMPRGALRFGAGSAEYVAHPLGRRCIRFRWNQGPSGKPGYPLELNAGFHLLELDADAHTDDTFADPAKLAGALRTLQEVQMAPAADLLLTPGDTLATGQWEAWYPSTVRRLRAPDERAKGSEIPLAPWVSWRESSLVWPRWDGLTDHGVRATAAHPFLQRIVDALDTNPEGMTGTDGAPLPTFNVDVQATPPIQPGSLADFFRVTAPSADPYGWGVLQRFGLSVTLSLRDEKTGEVIAGARLTDALSAVLAALAADPSTADYAPHLHVETLFQPGRAVALDAAAADAAGLLGIAQVSLRPVAAQPWLYARLGLRGAAGAAAPLVFALDAGTAVSLIDQNDPASGQVELAADPAAPSAVSRVVRLPASGETTLLLRGARIPSVGVALKEAPADAAALGELAEWVEYRPTGGIHAVLLRRPLAGLADRLRVKLKAALGDNAAFDALLLVVTPLQPFAPSDERSAYFATAPAALAARFADDAAEHERWTRFKRYAESLASTDPDVPAEQKIGVPLSGSALATVAGDYAGWSQRFLDHGGDLAFDAATGRAVALPGPWLATAYPRAGSPAYATPDAAGRLTYDHVVEDRWAHAYRYFVRPFGRYDLLWRSFRQSPALGGGARLEEAGPDPAAGGLDVVLDRTHPVAAPVVLGSRRLDPPVSKESPAAPGTTWEVLVAQHPEQALAERNATLARQLAFQQVAFTLLRRFAYPAWIETLGKMTGRAIEVRAVEDVHPAVPASYPASPDHLDPSKPLDDDTARALDLPLRAGSFQQGAMALRWDALPFFYEHRLLLAAQTARTVSALNEVVQRDFEYRTPPPSAALAGDEQRWTPSAPFGPGTLTVRARELRVPLRRFWDSLPDAARARWGVEAPDLADSAEARRKPASLPDPEVVYQVVESFTGNVEVQAELYFDAAAGRYATRQLGRRVLAAVSAVDAPPLSAPQGDFVLRAVLQPVVEETLSKAYSRDAVPAAVRAKLAFDGAKLFFAGTLTRADRDALVGARDAGGAPLFADADRAALERMYQEGFRGELFTRPVAVPAGMEDRVEVAESDDLALVWSGPLSGAERGLLRALPGDAEFRAALERLADAVKETEETARVPLVRGIDRVPAALAGRLTVARSDDGATYTGLRWTGPLGDDDLAALRGWARIAAARAAVDQLAASLDAAVARVPLGDGATPPGAIPDLVRDALEIGETELAWRGRLRSPAQAAALAALEGDESFRAAVQALLAKLDAAEAAVTMTVPVRPAQETLPASLRERLAIGRAALRYHGVMTRADAHALAALFAEPADRAAVGRLYRATLDAGMRGRTLGIRARRGSAAPSPLHPIETGRP